MKALITLSIILFCWFTTLHSFAQVSAYTLTPVAGSFIDSTAPQSLPTNNISSQIIGTTRYDLQTNASGMNRVYKYPDGTIGAVWTMGFNDPDFADRGTGYNYFNGSNWNVQPNVRIENEKTGWGQYSPWGPTGEIVASHTGNTNGILLSKRNIKGNGSWIYSYKQGPSGNENLEWPRMITNGNNNEYIHLIGLTAPLANGGTLYNGQDGSLLYSRSNDGGLTWNINNVQLPYTDTNYYVGIPGDNYYFTSSGNTLAFVCGSFWTDLFLLKSNDNGTTWTKTMIFQHPFPKFRENTTLITDTITVCDGSISVTLDANGIAHVFFGIMRVNNSDLNDGATLYWPDTDGLAYWNENMSQFTSLDFNFLNDQGNIIGVTQVLSGSGFVGLGRYYVSITSMPASCIDNYGYIYVIYSSLTSAPYVGNQDYRQLWGRRSVDGGLTWSNPIYITGDGSYTYTECVFPSLSSSSDDYLYLSFQKDTEPGLAVRGDMDPYGNNEIEFMKISKSIFSSTTIIQTSVKDFIGCPGLVKVPITVENMIDISSISLRLNFDTSQLIYTGYQNVNSLIASGTLLVNVTGDDINIAWFLVNPVTIYNDTLMELTFSGITGASELNWDLSTPGACYYTNSIGDQVTSYYHSGSLNIGACSHLYGSLMYANAINSPLNNIAVYLNQSGTNIDSAYTATGGIYNFEDVNTTGLVHIIPHCTVPYGGENAIDALLCMRHFTGSILLTGLKLKAADVDNTHFVNAADALIIMRRFVGLQNTFLSGDWIFEIPDINLIPDDTIYQDIHGLCFGDVDASYIPITKNIPACLITEKGIQTVEEEEFLIPVQIENKADLGAISLILSIPEGVEIEDTRMNIRGEYLFNIINNEYRFAWYSLNPQFANKGDVLFYLKARIIKNITGEWIAKSGSQLADSEGNQINDVVLSIPKLIKSSTGCILNQNTPNPFDDNTLITYFLPESGRAVIDIFDILGRKIFTLTDQFQTEGQYNVPFNTYLLKNGIYTYRLTFTGILETVIKTRQMIIQKKL